MTLAKTILRKQQKVSEHDAQIYIAFDNTGSSLKSCRGVAVLTADAYDKPACQKYDTHWPSPDYSFD